MRIFYDCEDGKMFNKGAFSCLHSPPTLLKIKLFTLDIDRALVNKEVFADPLTTKYFVDP